ncbi:MAG: HAD-IIB family hydrolase [Clostridia bacterium]|nr:HAD-IIB family hydrolase [Clostridia bacterium]
MTDFSKYLIATDLDGTFFDEHSQFVPRNVEALERFRAGGGLFTVATGRVQMNMWRRFGEFAAVLSSPAVMSNGAYLFDFTDGTAYLEEFIPAEIAEEILDLAHTEFPEVPFRVHIPNGLRVEGPNGFVGRDIKGYKPGCVTVSPSDKWRKDDWYKIVFRDWPESLAKVREALYERFGEGITMASSDPTILEIQAKGVTKAHGIDKLRRYLGNDKRIVITCGDFENDIPMHRAADISIAPANALDEVKAMCTHTVCHCREGVIADVIELIERGEL